MYCLCVEMTIKVLFHKYALSTDRTYVVIRPNLSVNDDPEINSLSLTVGLPEIWDTLEIQKIKICSEVPNFTGKMNFRSKCAEVSWLLRYSVFSVFTKISWPIFLSKLWKNWAGCNFFGDIPGFGLLHRFQKWSNFWKSIIQQLTYEQNAVWL